jgi:hypothetical protein
MKRLFCVLAREELASHIVPEGRLNAFRVNGLFRRPDGTQIRPSDNPAMNCRATFACPAGTRPILAKARFAEAPERVEFLRRVT